MVAASFIPPFHTLPLSTANSSIRTTAVSPTAFWFKTRYLVPIFATASGTYCASTDTMLVITTTALESVTVHQPISIPITRRTASRGNGGGQCYTHFLSQVRTLELATLTTTPALCFGHILPSDANGRTYVHSLYILRYCDENGSSEQEEVRKMLSYVPVHCLSLFKYLLDTVGTLTASVGLAALVIDFDGRSRGAPRKVRARARPRGNEGCEQPRVHLRITHMIPRERGASCPFLAVGRRRIGTLPDGHPRMVWMLRLPIWFQNESAYGQRRDAPRPLFLEAIIADNAPFRSSVR